MRRRESECVIFTIIWRLCAAAQWAGVGEHKQSQEWARDGWMDDVSCAFSFLLWFLFQVSRSANDTRGAAQTVFYYKMWYLIPHCWCRRSPHAAHSVSIIPVRRHEKLYIFNLCLSEYGNNIYALSPFNLGWHRWEFFCVAAALNFPVCASAGNAWPSPVNNGPK